MSSNRPSRAVPRLIVVLLVPLVLTLASTPTSAAPAPAPGDPLAGALKKAAKTELKELKATGNAAVKAVKEALKTASKDYGAGTVDANTAIADVVAAVLEQRDLLEDEALATASALAAAGTALLLPESDGEPLDAPRDFQAGGGGVWDDALADIEAELDKVDGKLDKELDRFLASMAKASKKLGEDVVIHYRLPAHGEDFWSVLSPGTVAATDGADGPDADYQGPSQVLIAVRFLDASGDDWACLGVRSSLLEYSLRFSTDVAEDVLVDEQAVDPGTGTGLTMQLMNGFANTSFANIRLDFEALLGSQDVITLSAPRVVTDTGEQATIAKELKKNGKKNLGFFNKDTGQVVNELSKLFKSHEKALAKGLVSTGTALATGLCDLEAARSDINFWQRILHGGVVGNAEFQLSEIPIVDTLMSGAFKQDACGIHADLVKKWQKAAARRHAQATQKFEKFADKLRKLAAKQGEVVEFNLVAGRNRPLGLPMITTAGADAPDQALVLPHLSDAFVLVEDGGGDGPGSVSSEVVVAGPSLSSVETSVMVVAGTTVVIGGIATNLNGVGKDQVPGLSDIPLLGLLFRSGESQDRPNSLIVMVTPRIVSPKEE